MGQRKETREKERGKLTGHSAQSLKKKKKEPPSPHICYPGITLDDVSRKLASRELPV